MCVPNWPEDFYDAHLRHWEDAELLFTEGRLANADHLYGLSAECGLKAVWIDAGMLRVPREHVNDFWATFSRRFRASLRNVPNQQSLVRAIRRGNPFGNWNVSQRYAPRRCFDQNLVEEHRRAAEEICALVRTWRIGRVTP